MWKTGCAAVMLAAAIATPSMAQSPQQTVESAQRFLSMTLPDLGYETTYYRAGLDEMRRLPNSQRARIIGHPIIVDASTVSRCRSKMIGSADHVILRVTGEGESSMGQLVPAFSRMGSPTGFHWGEDILSARAYGADVRIMFKGNTEASRLMTGAPDLAVRIAYAMEFLRVECDPAASTGF